MMFLQETHVMIKDRVRFIKPWVGQRKLEMLLWKEKIKSPLFKNRTLGNVS